MIRWLMLPDWYLGIGPKKQCAKPESPMNKGFGQNIWTKYLKILSDGQVDLL
jgi:hypothetical protein